MEMTRYFVEESTRIMSSGHCSSKACSMNDVYCNPFKTQEEFQEDFYRRVGYNTPSNDQSGAFQFGSIDSAGVRAGGKL
jgi:hypothetical protein